MSSCLPVALITAGPLLYGHSIERLQPVVICPMVYVVILRLIFKNISEDFMPFWGAPNTPVLDFW